MESLDLSRTGLSYSKRCRPVLFCTPLDDNVRAKIK